MINIVLMYASSHRRIFMPTPWVLKRWIIIPAIVLAFSTLCTVSGPALVHYLLECYRVLHHSHDDNAHAHHHHADDEDEQPSDHHNCLVYALLTHLSGTLKKTSFFLAAHKSYSRFYIESNPWILLDVFYLPLARGPPHMNVASSVNTQGSHIYHQEDVRCVYEKGSYHATCCHDRLSSTA